MSKTEDNTTSANTTSTNDSRRLHYPGVKSETDDSTRIVVQGSQTSATKYHKNHEGRPACGFGAREKTNKVWPADQARAWREPCKYCFANELDNGEVEP